MPPHVQLSAPKATAPLEERQQAYEALRGAEKVRPPNEEDSIGGLSSPTRTTSLFLGNGLEIFHPADLLPVINETSETAFHISEWERKRKMSLMFLGTGFGVGVLGITLGLIDAVNGDGLGSLAIVGGSIATVGVVLGIAGAVLLSLASLHRHSAFQSYDKSLQKRLRLKPRPPKMQSSRPLWPQEATVWSPEGGRPTLSEFKDGVVIVPEESSDPQTMQP